MFRFSPRGELIRKLIHALPIRRRWALYYLRAIAPRLPFVGRFRNGFLEVHPGELVSEMAYYYGFYEREVTAWCLHQFRQEPGKIRLVVDVGANFGYYPVLLGLVSGGTVRSIAFEPDPANFAWLLRNSTLNPVVNVQCEQMAVGEDDDGEVTIRQFGGGSTGSSRVVSRMLEHRVGSADLSVSCCRLDGYLDRADVREVSLVLIDVEGYEGNVIGGMRDGLAAGRYERVIVELHPWAFASPEEMAERVFEPFYSAGYTASRFRYRDNPKMDDQRATYVVEIMDRDPLGPVSFDNLGGWQHFLFVAPGITRDSP
jgi:FkbM family methyltransferase